MTDSDETALVRELRGLARNPAGEARFVIRSGAHAIEVAYSGGSSSSLALSARYDTAARPRAPVRTDGGTPYRDRAPGRLRAARPLAIALRPEDAADVGAKREGLSVEWQSGDPAFDAAVYVSTPTADAEVLAAVLGPDVRASVLVLFELGFQSVGIDEGPERVVTTRVTEFASRTAPREGRGARAVDAFRAILDALPALEDAGELVAIAPLAGWTRAMSIVGILGWSSNVGYAALVMYAVGLVAPAIWTLSSPAPPILGVAAGIVAGIFGSRVYASEVAARSRGTSRAHEHAFRARWAAFGGISVVTFTVVFAVAALVWSRPG